ncbi:MAG TPA: hypothetical protein DIS79_05315 [Bacteroidetes bacterium]|nr:hypothetical protein [Bacteroidota bacterium]HRK04552.1 hypothetical protein [Chlorobiota bacterium]
MIRRVGALAVIAKIVLLAVKLHAGDTKSMICMEETSQLSSNGRYLHVQGYDVYRVYDLDSQICIYTLRYGDEYLDDKYKNDMLSRQVAVSPSGDVHVTCRSGGNLEWFQTGEKVPFFVHRLGLDGVMSIELLNDSLAVVLRSKSDGTEVNYIATRGQIVRRIHLMHVKSKDHIAIGSDLVAYSKNDSMYIKGTSSTSIGIASYKPLKIIGDYGVIAFNHQGEVFISVDVKNSKARIEARNVLGAFGEHYFVLDTNQGFVLKYQCRDNKLVDTLATRIQSAVISKNVLKIFTVDSTSAIIDLEDNQRPELLFLGDYPDFDNYRAGTIVNANMRMTDILRHGEHTKVNYIYSYDTVQTFEHPTQDAIILSCAGEGASWYSLLDGLNIRNTVFSVPAYMCRVEHRDDGWYAVFAALQHEGETDSIRISLAILDSNYEEDACDRLFDPFFRQLQADTYAIVRVHDTRLNSDPQSRSYRRLSHDGQVVTKYVKNSVVQRNVKTGIVYREMVVPSDIVEGEVSYFVSKRTGQVVMSAGGHLWITTRLDTLRRNILQPVRINTLHGQSYVDVYQSTGKKLTTLRVHRGVVVVRPSLLRQGASYLLPKNKSGRPIAL